MELVPGTETVRIPLGEGNYVAFVKIRPNSARIRVMSADTVSSVVDFEKCQSVSQRICSSHISIDKLNRSLFVSDFAVRDGVIAAVSGGHMASFSPPKALGLVQIAGERLSRSHNTWLGQGVFCTDGVHYEIGEFDRVQALFLKGDCIQSGPLFLRNSMNRYTKNTFIDPDEYKLVDSIQEQAFTCTTKSGELILGVTGKMTLRDLPEVAAKKINCENAIRLTGYTTASLQSGSTLFGDEELPVYSVIAVFSRAQAINIGTGKQ